MNHSSLTKVFSIAAAQSFPLRRAPGGPSGRNRSSSVSKPLAYPLPVAQGRKQSSLLSIASRCPLTLVVQK